MLDKGQVGEQLVSNFVDSNFSKTFSFSSPKTKNKAEVADVLIWLNRKIFLIEVKTRDTKKGTVAIESWAYSQIKKACTQIRENIKRIQAQEEVFLHNNYYHSKLDCDGVCEVIGLIVLVHDGFCNVAPSKYQKDIYTCDAPIHVISWNDLEKISTEIETVADLLYYFQDRAKYLKVQDICLGEELNVVGYYKSHNNRFPTVPTDFSSSDFFDIYQSTMETEISTRDNHNKNAIWILNIEDLFKNQRKLMMEIPRGLFFSWELGMLSQRERAYYGEKIATVPQHFSEGNSERYFSYQNQNTKNWLLLHFTTLKDKKAYKRLEKLTKLKLINEIESRAFKYAIYSLCFNVSQASPNRLQVVDGIIMGTDAVKGKYKDADIKEASSLFGSIKPFKIEEFPSN